MKIYRTLPALASADIAESLRTQIHTMMDMVIAHPDVTPDDANNATYLKRSVDMDRSKVDVEVLVMNMNKIDSKLKLYEVEIDDAVLENLPDTPLTRFWERACALYGSYTVTEKSAA